MSSILDITIHSIQPVLSHQIEQLMDGSIDLGSDASSHYARGLCSMPHLQSLSLNSVKLSDEFYSTMASEASKSKIEKLLHMYGDLGSAASSHYARGLCSMPNLRSLDLYHVKLSDEFYSTMASEASKSKILMLSIESDSMMTPQKLHSILSLPCLQSLTLRDIRRVDMDDGETLIQTLNIQGVSMMTPRRLHSILSLPRLQSLTLRDIIRVDMDDGETLTRQTFSVDELSVDGKHVIGLWNLGLHTSCPRVQKLELNYKGEETVSSGVIAMACSPFHHLTHLHIQGKSSVTPCTLNNPVSVCDAVKTSCPQLAKLSFTLIKLNNEKAAEIIQLMKTHPHLTSIELVYCWANTDLDPLISEVNSEGKLTVTVKHG